MNNQQEQIRLPLPADVERKRAEKAEAAAQSAQQELEKLKADHAQQAEHMQSLNDQVSPRLRLHMACGNPITT